jgi:superfamily II DNA or RNA helicase
MLVMIFKTIVSNNYSRYDLQEVLKAKVDARRVGILDPTTWPKVDDVELNQSQLEAIQAALTKEFVVIQGPPGTGKTYVGLKIVQALLKNHQFWVERAVIRRRDWGREVNLRINSPMLVVCYTNHALDQFLEGKWGIESTTKSSNMLLQHYPTLLVLLNTVFDNCKTKDEINFDLVVFYPKLS